MRWSPFLFDRSTGRPTTTTTTSDSPPSLRSVEPRVDPRPRRTRRTVRVVLGATDGWINESVDADSSTPRFFPVDARVPPSRPPSRPLSRPNERASRPTRRPNARPRRPKPFEYPPASAREQNRTEPRAGVCRVAQRVHGSDFTRPFASSVRVIVVYTPIPRYRYKQNKKAKHASFERAIARSFSASSRRERDLDFFHAGGFFGRDRLTYIPTDRWYELR